MVTFGSRASSSITNTRNDLIGPPTTLSPLPLGEEALLLCPFLLLLLPFLLPSCAVGVVVIDSDTNRGDETPVKQ